MKHFVIVAGGEVSPETAAYLGAWEAYTWIAADAGLEFFYRNGRTPDIAVGDFDSVSGDVLAYFKEKNKIAWERLNPVKDDTDTEFAIRKALSLGAEKITLLGATGTRLDHVLGNIELLGVGLEYGVPMEILDAHNRIRMTDCGLSLRRADQYGKYVSLIPYTPTVSGLTLTGFRYPLSDYTLRGFCTLGVSNEIAADEARIAFEDGILIVAESRD